MSGSAPYLLYKELSPTSNLRQSCFFRPVAVGQSEGSGSRRGEYLFTAAVSAITIYEVVWDDASDTFNLVSVYHSSLFGKVQDVGIYRPRLSDSKARNMQQEYLVLSLDDGKFCLLRFDTNTLTLEPVSIYNSQENALGAGAIVKGTTHGQLQFGGVGLEPLVIVSDEYALGCSVVYGQQLFLFPLSTGTKSTPRADTSDRVGKDGNIPFLYDIHDSTDMPGNIIDICFLGNYSKPTLAVLQAAAEVTIGHAKAQRHTCTLTVLALDTVSRAATKLWRQCGLPHDSLRLLSLPKSPLFMHGNVMVVTMNALLVASPDQIVGSATNGFAAVTVSSQIKMQTWSYDTGIELDGSHWLEAAPHELIATLKDGRRLLVHLTGVLDNRCSLDYLRFGFGFLPSGPHCSCCCVNETGNLWFFGSSQGQGTLVSVRREGDTLSTEEQKMVVDLVLKSDESAERRALKSLALAAADESGRSQDGAGSGGSITVKKEALDDEQEQQQEQEQEEEPPAKKAKKAPAKKAPAKGKAKARGKAKPEPEPEPEPDAMDLGSDNHVTTAASVSADPTVEEVRLYGRSLEEAACAMVRESVSPLPRYHLQVTDSVRVLGPVVTAEYTHTDDGYDASGARLDWASLNLPREKVPVGSAAAFVAEREVKDCLQLGTGLAADGAITRAAQGRRYVKVASKAVPKASDVFCLEMRLQKKPYSLMVMSFGDGSTDMANTSKVMLVHEGSKGIGGPSEEQEQEQEAKVRDISLSEVSCTDDGDGFITTDITIALLELGPNVVLQVVRNGLRIVRLDRDKDSGGPAVGKGKAKGKGRGRSGSVDAPPSSVPPRRVDAASVASDWYTLQELRLADPASDGGLGCPDGEYLLSADALACPHDAERASGIAYLCLLTSRGSFFVLAYNVKECLATISHRQIAEPPVESSPATGAGAGAGDGDGMDVDVEREEAKEGVDDAAKVHPDVGAEAGGGPPAAATFKSSGDFDKCLPAAHSRIMGASFFYGAFPHCDPVRAPSSSGEGSGASAVEARLRGMKTPAKPVRGASSVKTPADSVPFASTATATATATATGGVMTPSTTARDRGSAWKVGAEEEYLYGGPLEAHHGGERVRGDSVVSVVSVEEESAAAVKPAPKGRKGKTSKASKAKSGAGASSGETNEAEAGGAAVPVPDTKVVELLPEAYLVLWTMEGSLLVLKAGSLECVFYCAELSLMPRSISVQRFEDSPDHPDGDNTNTAAGLPYNEIRLDSAHITAAGPNHRRLLHHVRLCELGEGRSASLCLVAIALTGDMFIYRYTGSRDARLVLSSSSSSSPSTFVTDTLFSKVQHGMVTRRRRNKILYNTRKLKALLDAGQEQAEAAQAADARVDGLDLESLQYIRSAVVPDPAGGNSVVISGGMLCSIQACGGLVNVIPVCLPEVHFMNAGVWALAPLSVPSLSSDPSMRGRVTRGLVTLWLEHDADTLQAKSQRMGLVGLYQEAPGYFCMPGSVLSFKRQVVGRTVRATSEVTAKGDDKLEQELLARRTSFYACSVPRSRPFEDTKVSEEDRVAALALYDRYYPEMKSFLEPDAEGMGAPPQVPYQTDSMVLVQDAKPVSEFVLPDDEQIIDMEYCTLPVEKISQSTYFQASSRSGMVPQMTKKKVFVVVGTQRKDTHGEDSPGEGRLLLFGLDFNDFQTPEEKAVIEARRKEEEERREQERAERERAGGDPMDIPPPPIPLFPSNFTAKSTPKLSLLWAGPGPASIVKAFGDYVISAVDNTLFVYRYMPVEKELEQIAFYDAKIYIKSVSIERNYILISDFLHSVQLLVWSRDEYTLTLLGKDFNPCVGLSTSFLRDHSSMGLMVGDDEGNLQMLMYAPLRPESKDGMRLLLQADFHLGCEASVLLQHAALYTAPASASATGQIQQMSADNSGPGGSRDLAEGARAAFKERIRQRQAALQIAPFAARMNKKGKKDNVLVATLEGGVGLMSALEEKTYRRLALLQQIMITTVRSPCALNPREFRLLKTAHFRAEKKRGVLDGTLLYQYVCMDGPMQDEIAAAMGVTADLLLDNLREVDLSAAVF